MKEWYSIVLTALLTIIIIFITPDIPIISLDISVFVFTLFAGGFLATYLSDNGKRRNGLFVGILIILIILFLSIFHKNAYSEIGVWTLVLGLPTLPLITTIGGFTAKKIRQRKSTYNGYLVCDKCSEYYKLQPGESPEDFTDQCECGGKLKYYDNIDSLIH